MLLVKQNPRQNNTSENTCCTKTCSEDCQRGVNRIVPGNRHFDLRYFYQSAHEHSNVPQTKFSFSILYVKQHPMKV